MASVADVRLERALSLLRARRGRVTTARRAVLAALLDRGDHVTADELADDVRARHPEVHLSTVYRSLDAFERLGVVTHVHLGHGRATYHLVDELHHHAVCEGCGAVVELPDDLLGAVAERVHREFGFEVEAHHFALSGRCASCAAG
jgi:Fur family ferric uptake transcriptional regulator